MANHVSEKFLTTSADTYRHPLQEQSSYHNYHPQIFTDSKFDYHPNKGTKTWFQDYRRSVIAEKTLRQNLSTFKDPIRPTDFSDKPDIALGERKIHRESFFPIIHNNPVYKLTNFYHDYNKKFKDFEHDIQEHRTQYKDLTGSLHKKVDHFYQPFPAKEAFNFRRMHRNFISDYPGHLTAAKEFLSPQREKDLVDYSKLDVCI